MGLESDFGGQPEAFIERVRTGDFTGALYRIAPGELWHAYQALWPMIPADQRYAIFHDHVYTRCEFGFAQLDPRGLRQIFAARADWSDWPTVSAAIHRLADADGMITVYRGVDRESMPAPVARSWSTSRQTAQWFARRYEQFAADGGKWAVWRARVRAAEVLDYLTDRNEAEILVDPATITDLECVQSVL